MIKCQVTLRKWGNSLGFTLPKNVVEKEHLKVDETVKILVIRKNDAIRNTFGIIKGSLKKSTQEIKNELRRELYDN